MAKSIVAYGDSITLGQNLPGFVPGTPPPAACYISKIASALGVSKTIRASSGHMCSDQAWSLYGTAPSIVNDYTVLLGTNDAQVYGDSAAARTASLNFLRNILVWNLCPAKFFARNGNVSYSGMWIDTTVNSVGRNTATLNSKASITVSGVAIYVSYILQHHVASEGVIDIKVDGVVRESVVLNGTQVPNTQFGRSYSGATVRVGGLAPGPHVVEAVHALTGKTVHLEYVAGAQQSVQPRIFVGDFLRRSAAGYGTGTNSDANIEAYNVDLAVLIAELQADGHPIFPVHFSDFDPNTHQQADGLHPNIAGHAVISDAFYAAMADPAPEFTFDPVTLYKRSDGKFFAGDGQGQREVVVV